ncbi:hypothetical protein B0J11DRAFT_578155 [Dendryphion nanum]|uniref:F-box domain-containing protein n=1 Tax=Dendryphion nanum TaxID=256645 RepID=A0A9P9E3Z8_9PLEO|nr:hypothetical protein B0J11DRAFT_578155 [Dendryphion nanum]
MGSFSALPSELQILIFSYLNCKDLKTARQLCQKCDQNASPALFNTAVACARYQALGTLKKISLHSILPKYVKEIHFDGSVYNKLIAESEQTYCSLENEHVPDAPGNLFHKRNRWRRYRELFNEQEEVRNSLILLHETSRALDLLPNVKTVVYSPHPLQVPSEAKLMRYILPRGITDRYAMSSWKEHLVTSQHGIHHVLGAIHQSQYTGIREFKVLASSSDQASSTELTIFVFDMDSQFAEAAPFFFNLLEKVELNLSLSFPTGARGALGDGQTQLANLGALLTTAANLRDLTLNFYHWKTSMSQMYGHITSSPLYSSLGLDAVVWAHLQSLCLGGVYAEEEHITSLITRHENTLRKLEFSYCSLCSGLWANIVDAVLSQEDIVSFSIYRVNETTVKDKLFENMPDTEREYWQFEGRLRVCDGQREFDEPLHKTVYASRP